MCDLASKFKLIYIIKKSEKTNKDERPVYILCPRCEINYIDKRDKLCAVCKAEMGIGDPSILLPDEEEEQGDRICPVCRVNLLGEDEDICFECKKEREEQEKETKEVTDNDDDENNSWEPFADEEEEEIPDGMQEILIDEEEEEDEEEFDDVETVSDEPDDFDYNVDPNDFEDDEEEEEDEL